MKGMEKMPRSRVLALTLMPFLALAVSGPSLAAEHALALHGEPKYGPDFEHLDYVNPEAPKGGTLKRANVAASTFDSLHPLFCAVRLPRVSASFMTR